MPPNDWRTYRLGDVALFGRQVIRLSEPLAFIEADLTPGPEPMRGVVAVVWPKPPTFPDVSRVTALQIRWLVVPTEENKADVARLIHKMRVDAETGDPEEPNEDERRDDPEEGG